MKQKLVITGAALALMLGGAGVASAAPQTTASSSPSCTQPPCEGGPGGTPVAVGSPVTGADDTGLDDGTDETTDADTTDGDDEADAAHEDGSPGHEHEDGTGGEDGDDDQVSVVPEGGAPTGDGSTEGRTGWWVGGGLLAALAAAGLAFRRRLAGLAGR